MKILKPSKIIETTWYSREFERREHPGCFVSPPCDAEGRVDWSDVLARPAAALNVFNAINDPETFVDRGARAYHSRYVEPAAGRCDDCNRWVQLGGFTNTCECGADYNGSGHRLAPRECWGEETGEHWTECY